MTRPVKGSDLEKQIEMAQRNIEQWPRWLRIASGIESPEDKSDAIQVDRNSSETSASSDNK